MNEANVFIIYYLNTIAERLEMHFFTLENGNKTFVGGFHFYPIVGVLYLPVITPQ